MAVSPGATTGCRTTAFHSGARHSTAGAKDARHGVRYAIAASASGAITRIVLQGDVAFIGTTNGGVWKTTNIHVPRGIDVHWEPVLDQQPVSCSSIGELVVGTNRSLRDLPYLLCKPMNNFFQ